MGILEGMVAGAGEALQNVGLQGVAAAIQAERDARLSEIRLSEEATIRQRGKDDAAAERGREDVAARGFAEQRTGLIAERQGLDDASYVGADENPGYIVQKGQAVPNNRDYLGAQRKFSELARLDEGDQAQVRQDKRDIIADEKDSRDYALRETQAKTASIIADMQYKTAKLAYDRASADAKIPPAVDRAMKSRDEELKAINAQIIKLQGDNMPVGDALLTRKAAIVKEINTLIEPYLSEDVRSKLTGSQIKTPKQAAIDFLLAGKGTPEQFDEEHRLPSGTGAAIISNTKPAALTDTKPAALTDTKPAANRPFPDVKVKEGGLLDTAAKYYGSSDPQRAYLQGKIDRKEPLTPSEKVRAQRLKLIPA